MEALIPWVTGVLIILGIIAAAWYTSSAIYKRVKKIEPQPKPVPAAAKKNSPEAEFAEEITPFPVWEKPADFPDPELPSLYNKDCLMLMVRDPYWLYAYWEISAAKHEELKNKYGDKFWKGQPVIRLYDITGVHSFDGTNANSYTDIYINGICNDWYIEIASPDRKYCIDLGRILPGGQFVTMLRSNIVKTPRAALSDRFDEDWMWIDGIYQSMGRVQYGISTALIYEEIPSSPEFNKPMVVNRNKTKGVI
ncbi:MAG: DUF4912 domain-containing protein [Desulfotomaculum sp.]|nr:DUF4912 domain-containing protein [Desulfotomaculum sp.]